MEDHGPNGLRHPEGAEMRVLRRIAAALLALAFAASLAADFAPYGYVVQLRETPNAACSSRHWLGTDELGRDRFSRLLHGTRVSLLLAPLAALLSTLLAALIGGLAGYLGGWWEWATARVIDWMLALPWLFLLLMVRAMLPLNVAPATSVALTFALLGLLGWAAPARVVAAGVRSLQDSEFVLQARARGCGRLRLLLLHILPNLRPVLLAQFWTAVPLFILSEANLGLLGLGVAEPLPSWGTLLRDLENYSLVLAQPWLLAPVLLLIVVVSCFQLVLSREVFEQ